MTRKTGRTTGIEWTTHTWNPMVGCAVYSAGCENCYAMRQAFRLEHAFGMPQYMGTTIRDELGRPRWTGVVNRASDRQMRKPYTLSPGLVFVNSMSDFFSGAAEDSWRQQALGVMLDCPQHEFQILTKRPHRIRPFAERAGLLAMRRWFPDNVWIGATVEDRKAVARIEIIREVRAAVRFLSCEPLLGSLGELDLDGIDWVIAGGESGPGARPMDVEWVREIRDQCADWSVPFFFKQWGQPSNNPLMGHAPDGQRADAWLKTVDPNGKGGSLLDGEYHKDFPFVVKSRHLDLSLEQRP